VIALFCNGVKGVAAFRMARDVNINPKLLHKLREAMGGAIGTDELTGTVEVDGAYFARVRSKQTAKPTDLIAVCSKSSVKLLSLLASAAAAKPGLELSPRNPTRFR
jgi:hypothetical protein